MTLLYCTKTNHITNDLYIFVHFSIFFLPRLCNFWNSTQFSGFCKLLIRTFYSNLMTRHLFWNILISYSNIYEYSERLYFFHIQKTTFADLNTFCELFSKTTWNISWNWMRREQFCGKLHLIMSDWWQSNCVQIIIHLKTEVTTFS